MKKIFSLFKIQKEERLLVLFFLVVLVALNGLVINLYYDKFTPFARFYWPLFIRNFHVSGFDPITYSIISDWWAGYNVYRHPLLAFFMYPFYLLNKLLMYITGINCAIFIMPFLQTFCGIYGFVFFYRILRTSLKLRRFDASLLTIMLFSFAYILLSCIVPDHFIMSFFMLVFTLYVASQRIDKQLLLTKTQTILLFVVTGGISLNNGLKVFLASLFVNGKKFFNWRYLLLAIILPSAVMWGVSKWEYKAMVWPVEMQRKADKQKKDKALKAKQIQKKLQEAQKQKEKEEASTKELLSFNSQVQNKQDSVAKPVQNKVHAKKEKKQPKQGAPISEGQFMSWTDVTTSRTSSIVENLFGEGAQLHQDHTLEDVLRNRPMIVPYRYIFNYAIEGLLLVLFLAGLFAGRKQKLMQLCASWWLLDMVLHVGLGFGINEVYIMTAHWAFVIPLAIAHLFRVMQGKALSIVRVVAVVITLFLFLWNVNWLVVNLI